MTLKKLDNDSVYVNINTKEAEKDDVLDYVVLGDEESEKAHNADTGKAWLVTEDWGHIPSNLSG